MFRRSQLLPHVRFFFFNDTATTEIYPLSLHAALPIPRSVNDSTPIESATDGRDATMRGRSEEHTSGLQSRVEVVCRLLLEKKKHAINAIHADYKYAKTQCSNHECYT